MDFKACFDQVYPTLPGALFSERYINRIRELAPELKCFSLASLEFRLAENDDTIDLALGFKADTNFAWLEDFIQNQFTVNANDPEPTQGIDPVLLYFTRLNRERLFWEGANEGFWLNLDLRNSSNTPVPWTYMVFRELNLGPGFYIAVLKKTLGTFGFKDSRTTMDGMQDVILKLPDNAFLLGLALPTWRNANTFRLVIYGMSFDQILNFLGAVQWPGDLKEITLSLESVAGQCKKLGLLIDIMEGKIQAKIGVELLVHASYQAQHIKQLLQSLVRMGLCDPVKEQVLNLWAGKEIKSKNWLKHHSIPNSLNVRQWINHFKLVYHPGQPILAKGYLGFQPF